MRSPFVLGRINILVGDGLIPLFSQLIDKKRTLVGKKESHLQIIVSLNLNVIKPIGKNHVKDAISMQETFTFE